MTDPDRFRGTNAVGKRGRAIASAVARHHPIEVDQVLNAKGWIEAGLGVLTYGLKAKK
jgi:hypothetical protein